MKKKTYQTIPVIFRKFKDNQVIAFFPTETGTYDLWTCCSYMHVGQHSSASTDLIPSLDRCTYKELKPLFDELKAIYETGDDPIYLAIRSKNHSSYFNKRRLKLI
jgi:hypothetical protein